MISFSKQESLWLRFEEIFFLFDFLVLFVVFNVGFLLFVRFPVVDVVNDSKLGSDASWGGQHVCLCV